MRAARAGSRVLCATVMVVVLAGCGGGDDTPGDADESTARQVDRSGYFTSTQSDALNPALATYDAAFRTLDAGHAACSREAARLFEAGRPQRASVACHLDDTAGVITALDGLRETFDDIDGSDYRAACESQLEEMDAFLEEYHDAWTAVQQDGQAYAAGRAVTDEQTQEHVDAARAMHTELITSAAPELSRACYTKADRDVAAEESDNSAAAQGTDDAGDDS